MSLEVLNRALIMLAILCISGGVMAGVLLLWGVPGSEFLWKCLGTEGIILLGTCLTLNLLRTHERQ